MTARGTRRGRGGNYAGAGGPEAVPADLREVPAGSGPSAVAAGRWDVPAGSGPEVLAAGR